MKERALPPAPMPTHITVALRQTHADRSPAGRPAGRAEASSGLVASVKAWLTRMGAGAGISETCSKVHVHITPQI